MPQKRRVGGRVFIFNSAELSWENARAWFLGLSCGGVPAFQQRYIMTVHRSCNLLRRIKLNSACTGKWYCDWKISHDFSSQLNQPPCDRCVLTRWMTIR